jgi:hypothetical protein
MVGDSESEAPMGLFTTETKGKAGGNGLRIEYDVEGELWKWGEEKVLKLLAMFPRKVEALTAVAAAAAVFPLLVLADFLCGRVRTTKMPLRWSWAGACCG